MVALYVWFLCYLSWGWNSVTVESHGVLVNHTSHPGSPFMTSKKHIKKLAYPWGQLRFGGWQWWRCWCHPRPLAQSWHVPPQSRPEHNWTWDTNAKSTSCHPNRPEVNVYNTISKHFQPTWKLLWRDLAARGRCRLQVWELQCVCLHTLLEGAATLQLCTL